MPSDAGPKRESLLDMVIGSTLISWCGAGIYLIAGRYPANNTLEALFIWLGGGSLALGWLAAFVYAIGKFGKRGLWLLLGAPTALWAIFMFLVVLTAAP